MTWGVDLWDRMQEAALHVDKGIEGCEKLRSFIKERCVIELDYAARLKKLIKTNTVVPKKGKTVDDELPFTWQKAFQGMLTEINDLAIQHERLVELLQEQTLKPLDETTRSSKDGKKRVVNEVATAEVKYKQSKKQLESMQERYKRSFAMSVQSEQNYERAEKDVTLSRVQVDKAKADMLRKRQDCDDAKKDYASQLERTNEDQRVHFSDTVPSLMNQLEEIEVKRITTFRDCLQQANESERNVIKIMAKCLDGVEAKLTIIDAQRDNQLALDTMKTGNWPPEAFPFEELTLNNIGTLSSASKPAQPNKGAVEVRRDFGHLPPNQQKIEVNKKLSVLRDELAKKTKEMDGVQKLEQTYRQNPKLGNPDSMREQMVAISKRIEALNTDIREYEGYLRDAESRCAPGGGVTHKQSVTSPSGDQRATLTHSVISSASSSQESQRASRPAPAPAPPQHQQSSIDDDFEDQQPAVGRAIAMYAYDANDASALSISAQEILLVIEADTQNSGWTRVRRTHTADEGYVPTAYLKIELS